jgi:two-component system, chemotaxis family, sensor kinase CheA
MDELTREFVIESQEGLDRMERCLTDLEKRPEDAALIAEIFRSVHTIKGTTGFLGYTRLEKLAHAGENLLGLLRDGKLRASAGVVTVLLELLDALRRILRSIEAEENEGAGDDAVLIGRLVELQNAGVAEAVPVAAAVNARKPRKRTSRARSKTIAGSAPGPVPGFASEDRSRVDAAAEGERAEAVHTAPAGAMAAAESTLRVDVALLNRMMNLVGELVLARNQVLQVATGVPRLTQLSRRLDMITADLRESVMKARMQPVSSVFSKVPRLIRDLSQALGRRVRLEMEGQETELDKSLLEAIKDPLTHAIRNALDHGIEPPEARIAAGKSAEGLLRIRASQEGSHVIIEVCDDGAGIPVERVREKAIERGLISAEHAAQQSERELLQLIFLPGFSTASAITNVSGRGVGMDVVRTNVEKIGGKVEIDSHPGKGTTLRLRIPLTLAIVPALIVRSAGQSFALPQAALSELVHVSSRKAASIIEWIENAPLYRLRGRLLPLVFLDRLLGEERDCRARDSYIAVLDADGRRFGLVVDGLADPEEIVVKPLNASLKGIGLYSGATVLGNGNVALILDPTAIAVRSGVGLAGEEMQPVADETRTASAESTETEYLLVGMDGERAAVPLDCVVRIEQMPLARIEYIGGQPVINVGGEIMSVHDGARLLSARNAGAESQVVVVVCQEGNRQVAVIVSHVLDVAAGSGLVEAGSGNRARGAIRLKEHVTTLIDLASAAPLSLAVVDHGQMTEALL